MRPSREQPALLRVSEIVRPNGILPIARSTWWQGVREGRFPQPIKLGPRITCWRAEDIERVVKGEFNVPAR